MNSTDAKLRVMIERIAFLRIDVERRLAIISLHEQPGWKEFLRLSKEELAMRVDSLCRSMPPEDTEWLRGYIANAKWVLSLGDRQQAGLQASLESIRTLEKRLGRLRSLGMTGTIPAEELETALAEAGTMLQKQDREDQS